jgi:hypothetical protein
MFMVQNTHRNESNALDRPPKRSAATATSHRIESANSTLRSAGPDTSFSLNPKALDDDAPESSTNLS